MALFWGRKEKEIKKMIDKYMCEVSNCLQILSECFKIQINNQALNTEEIKNPVHEAESKADDIRREINLKLHSGILMPEARQDLYSLMEAIDKIPNKAETIIETLVLENLLIPEELKKDFSDLLESSIDTARTLEDAVNTLFYDYTKTLELSTRVDKLESQTDRVNRRLIKKIFSSSLSLAEKLHLKQFTLTISSLSDRAENAANILELIAVKRKT